MGKPMVVNREQAARLKDYIVTFSTVEGRRVLEDLKSEFVMRESYVRGDLFETIRRTCCRDLVGNIERMANLAGEQIEVEED